jgi:peptide/nickel transport system permease protein
MMRFVLRRGGFFVLTVLAVSILIFALTQVLPGDVATMILGQSATPEDLATLRRQLGLDQSAVVQYWRWAHGMLTGDLGISTRFNQSVASILSDRLAASAWLAFAGLLLAIPGGMGFGILAGLRPGRVFDHLVSSASLFAAALPEYVTGAFLIMMFSTGLGWFPPFSATESGMSLTEQAHRLVLPAITLNLVVLAYTIRMMRASMIEVMASPFVRAAVLQGLPRATIIFRYALPNALGPTVTVIALSIGWTAGGLVIVENMFGYPGIGRMLVFAIQNRDMPMIQAISLVIATIYALANFAADLINRLLDPRTGDV